MNAEALFELVNVNNRPIFIPNDRAWEKLHSSPYFNNEPIALLELVWEIYHFTIQHPELVIGFHKAGYATRYWSYIVLLTIEDAYQRVHLERVKCTYCDWFGMIANPHVIDLYVDVPDWYTALTKAQSYANVRCPSCTSILPRAALWAEPNKRQESV